MCNIIIYVARCRRSIPWNVASLNILFDDMIKLFYYKHWTDKWKYFYVQVFPLLKNPTCYDPVLMVTSFEIIFWDDPENLCESLKYAWLVYNGSVGTDLCYTSEDLVFRASQIWKKHVVDVWPRIFGVDLTNLFGKS